MIFHGGPGVDPGSPRALMLDLPRGNDPGLEKEIVMAKLLTAGEAQLASDWACKDAGAIDGPKGRNNWEGELSGILDAVAITAKSGPSFLDMPLPRPAVVRALKALGYMIQYASLDDRSNIRLHWGRHLTEGRMRELRELTSVGYITGLGAPFTPLNR